MAHSPSSPVGFGVIGYGAWGSHHARAAAECPDTRLIAIAARSTAAQAAVREKHPQTPVVADYQELLKNPAVEVVSVVLPNDLHHQVGCDVLAAGKHLLLEKPMSLSVAQCDDLIRCAKQHHRILSISHEFRQSSLWGKVKQIIDSGEIGEPLYGLVELWRNPYRQGAGGWRYDINRVGDWILEEPIHFFDLARWYFGSRGNPIRVTGRANAADSSRPELQNNFTAIVDFPGGAYAIVSQTLSGFEHHQTVKLTGTKGAVWANWSGAMDRTFTPTFWLKQLHQGQMREISITRPAGEVYELVEQYTAMAAAVRGRPSVLTTGEDGRWAVALCTQAQESVKRGVPIEF